MSEFTEEDRAKQDFWLQKIPEGSAAGAILHVLELVLKHELGDIRTVIQSYQDTGRSDDATILRISESMAIIVAQNDAAVPKVTALLDKVQLLENSAQVVIIDQAQNQRRLDRLEQGPHSRLFDVIEKLTSLVSHVAALEVATQYATISRAKVNQRLDALEEDAPAAPDVEPEWRRE
jgi:hypothetical protein